MDPAQLYASTFRTRLARDAQTHRQIQRLRYQVYCQEFGYEAEADCPNGLESDDYDRQSWHCLLEHRLSGPVGCIRLVRPQPAASGVPLPFERYCGHALDRRRFDPAEHDPLSLAEFSRLAVKAEFRRRRNDPRQPVGIARPVAEGTHHRSPFPVIPVALFVAGLSLMMASPARYAVAMMEPRLARMLRRFGIRFEPIGRVIEYHGPRGPFLLRRDTAFDALDPHLVAMMALVRSELFGGQARREARDRQRPTAQGTGTDSVQRRRRSGQSRSGKGA